MSAEAKIVAIKEDEIRPDDLFQTFLDLSANDAQNFFDPTQFEEIDCPACGEARTQDSFEKHSFSYGECISCGTLYASPRPNRAELLRYYATSESQKFWIDNILKKTGEKRKESIMRPNLQRVLGLLEETGRTPKTVVDIGAANGAFLSEWNKARGGCTLIAVEPGEKAAQTCRDQGFTVYEDFIEDLAEQNAVQGDLVTCFEVLEHTQNPARFARAMADVTAPGGAAIMSGLGADGFDIQLLWEESRSVMPPYHLNFLSKKGLELLFSGAGFDTVHIFTPGRLDVDILKKSMERGADPKLSRFEKLLLKRGEDTHQAFQKFLAEHALSSHVWIMCTKNKA